MPSASEGRPAPPLLIDTLNSERCTSAKIYFSQTRRDVGKSIVPRAHRRAMQAPTLVTAGRSASFGRVVQMTAGARVVEVRITWRSGAVTVHRVDRPPVGSWAPCTSAAIVERVRALAATCSAAEIAVRVRPEGLRSAHGKALQEHHILVTAPYSLARRSSHTWRKLPLR